MKHLTSISESLNSVWDTPKRKNTDGSVNRTKKAKIAQKEPRKNISKNLAIQHPHTKIPDSEIKLENIIQGSPLFVPHQTQSSKGKGKGIKGIKLKDCGSASEMARRKTTLTAKQKAARASKSAQAAKNATPKTRQTTATGKPPHKPLPTKAARKQAGGQGVKKPFHNYAMIAL